MQYICIYIFIYIYTSNSDKQEKKLKGPRKKSSYNIFSKSHESIAFTYI